MAILHVTEALKLVGSAVSFELAYDDGEGGVDISHCLCFVAGVVLGLEGVYPHPHFVVYYLDSIADKRPEQVFFEDIRSYRYLPETRQKRPIKPVYGVGLLGSKLI